MKVVLGKPKEQRPAPDLRERVDRILDKINEVGYDNLTEDEKRILLEASSKLSRKESKDGPDR